MLVLVDPSVAHVQRGMREMDKPVMILTRYVKRYYYEQSTVLFHCLSLKSTLKIYNSEETNLSQLFTHPVQDLYFKFDVAPHQACAECRKSDFHFRLHNPKIVTN